MSARRSPLPERVLGGSPARSLCRWARPAGPGGPVQLHESLLALLLPPLAFTAVTGCVLVAESYCWRRERLEASPWLSPPAAVARGCGQ